MSCVLKKKWNWMKIYVYDNKLLVVKYNSFGKLWWYSFNWYFFGNDFMSESREIYCVHICNIFIIPKHFFNSLVWWQNIQCLFSKKGKHLSTEYAIKIVYTGCMQYFIQNNISVITALIRTIYALVIPIHHELLR